MILSEAWQGKRYAVYGLARSGLASVEALVRSGAKVACWDDKEEARGRASPLAERIDFLEAGLDGFDALVVSPGVPLNRHPIRELAEKAECEIIGDVELFARARGTLPEHKVVGITGTNGKSTTTALITHILKEAAVPATMSGNIGVPILSQDPLPAGGVYVLELSSYQIDITQSLDCEVAVLLNVTPDHLDRYDGSFEKYVSSKARLFEMQTEEHDAVATSRDWWGKSVHDVAKSGFLDVSDDAFHVWQAEPGAIGVTEQGNWPSLQGPHNMANVESAMSTCYLLGLDGHQIRKGLETFPGLPHRLERVAEHDGVSFVNDSKATNPASAAPALAAYDKVRWIVGGQAKTESLDELEAQLGHVVKAYLIGESEDLWARLLDGKVETVRCGTLEDAVKAAAADASAGEVVLLSPACASFDQFAHFEARGDAFREAVAAL